jgi:E3 Ubiquitin ligase
MTDSRDIGYALFGLGFGVWYFFHGLGVLRKKRFIESIPTSTVRGLAIGLVELNGKAKKTKTLKSPLTGTECTFYRYTVERYESSGRSGRWVLIAHGDSVFCPFCLDDSTGQIMVLPKGAEFVMPADYSFTTGLGSGLPDNLVNFMGQNGLQYKGLFGNYSLRFHEWYIKPDETVFVVGTAQKNTTQIDEHIENLSNRLDELKQNIGQTPELDLSKEAGVSMEGWKNAVANAEHGLLQEESKSNLQEDATDVIIAKGDQEIFIVSDESQTEVVKSFSWQAFAGIWGGSALSLALLAYLLFRLGVWARF